MLNVDITSENPKRIAQTPLTYRISMEIRNCNILISLHLFVNVLLQILGMSLLGLGLAEESSQLVSLLTPESKIGGTAVVIGVIIIVVTTINCCFTIDGSSYVYYFYAGFLLLLFSVMVGLLIGYNTSIEKKIRRDIRSSMEGMMRYDPVEFAKTYMDPIQQSFQCCGIDSYKDWQGVTENPTVPASCCIQVGCDTSNVEKIYQKDCFSSMMSTVDSQLTKISAIGYTTTVLLPIQALLVYLITRRPSEIESV